MKQFHHRGLARVLTSLLAAAAISSAAWPEIGTWREDFQRVDVGSLPAGWQRQIVPPGSTIGVQRAARPGTPDNKALAAADRRGDKQLIAYAPFPAIRGVVVAEVDFMLDGETISPVSCLYFGSPSAPDAISVAAFSGRQVRAAHGSEFKPITKYTPGTWHHLTCIADPARQQWLIRIDQQPPATGPFRHRTSEFSLVQFNSHTSANNVIAWYDNLVVRPARPKEVETMDKALKAKADAARRRRDLRTAFRPFDTTKLRVPQEYSPNAWWRTPAADVSFEIAHPTPPREPTRARLVVRTRSDASPTVQFAADELRRYIFLITGEWPATAGSGHAAAAVVQRRAGPAKDRWDEDGFEIRTGPEGLVLTGDGDRGALYAVYEFLRSRCECRWFYADADDEVVPRMALDDLLKIITTPGAATHRPRLRYRDAAILSADYLWGRSLDIDRKDVRDVFARTLRRTAHFIDWAVKNGFNAVNIEGSQGNMYALPENWDLAKALFRVVKRRGLMLALGGHFWPPLLNDECPGWPKDNRWGAVRGGRRLPVRRFGHTYICTTHEPAVDAFLKNVVGFFRANPEFDVWSNWPPDGDGWCECEMCSVFSPSYRFVLMHNQIARALEQDGQRPLILHLCYGPAAPPDEPLALHPAVHPMIDGYRDFSPPYSAFKLVEQWREFTQGRNDLVLFGRFCRHILVGYHLLPLPSIPGSVANMEAEGMLGAHLFHGRGGWWTKGLSLYATGRAFWDRELDLATLEPNYFQRYYGPAAAVMQEFFHFTREVQRDPNTGAINLRYINNHDSTFPRGNRPSYCRQDLRPADAGNAYPGLASHVDRVLQGADKARAILQRARAAASHGDKQILKRINKAALSREYYEHQQRGRWHTLEGLRLLQHKPDQKASERALAEFESARAFAERREQWVREHTCYYSDEGRDDGTLWDGGLRLAASDGKRDHSDEWIKLVRAMQERARKVGWPAIARDLPFSARYPDPK